MDYYHGSKNGNVKEVLADYSKDGFVYASSSRLVALCYAVKVMPNFFTSNNNEQLFVEIMSNLFETMTKGKKVFIYKLKSDKFIPVMQSDKCVLTNCFKANENVTVLEKEEIPNAYEEFLKYQKSGEFKLIKCEQLDDMTKNNAIQMITRYVKTLSDDVKNDKSQFWYLFK